MPQSKNKYTLFRKVRKNKKTKRKKGGAASSPTPEDAKIYKLYEELKNLGEFEFEGHHPDVGSSTTSSTTRPTTIPSYSTKIDDYPISFWSGTTTSQLHENMGNYPLNPVYEKMARIHESIRERFEQDKNMIRDARKNAELIKQLDNNEEILGDLRKAIEKGEREVPQYIIEELRYNAMKAVVNLYDDKLNLHGKRPRRGKGTKKRKRKRKRKRKGKNKTKGKK